MSPLQSSSRLQNASQAQGGAGGDWDIREAEARVRAQEAHVLRLIVQGAPTHIAEEVLRQLTATAEAIKQRRRLGRRG